MKVTNSTVCRPWGKLVLSAIALALLLAIGGGCAKSPQSSEQQQAKPEQPANKTAQEPAKPVQKSKLMLAIPAPSVSFLPFIVAKESGILQEAGFEAEMVMMTADKAVAALISGDLDYTGALGSTLRAASKGHDVKVIMAHAVKPTHSLSVNSKIKTPADLKGKTLGASAAAASDAVVTKLLLEKLGLIPGKDVQIVYVGAPPQRAAALREGIIDGTVQEPPLIFVLEKDGFPILVDASTYIDEPITGLGTSNAKLKQHPEEVKQVLTAFVKALQFMQKNRDETIKIMATWLKVEEPVAARAYDKTKGVWSPDGSMSAASFQLELDIAREIGELTAPVDPKQVADFAPLEAVQKSMGLK